MTSRTAASCAMSVPPGLKKTEIAIGTALLRLRTWSELGLGLRLRLGLG